MSATTATDPISDAEALRGPWLAVLAWRDGYVCTWDDLDRDDAEPGDVRIQIVRATATPTDRDNDGLLRLARTHRPTDLLVEWDGEDFASLDEIRALWAQAQAMVAGLNAAAAEVSR